MGYYDDVKNKKAPFESHYISAYGLAVKHGYKGTEEEWIAENDIARAEVLKNKEAAEAAKTGAEAAKESAERDSEAIGKTLTYILEIESGLKADRSAAVSAKNEAVSARNEAISARDETKSAKAEAVTARNSAQAARDAAEDARDKAEAAKTEAQKVAEDLAEYVKVDDVFESAPFAWTDFHYWADGANGFIGTVGENSIVIDNAEDDRECVEFACRGNRLGFTVSVSGSGMLRINGEYRQYEDETVTIPPTYLTRDLFFYGVGSTWYFTDMVRLIPSFDFKVDTEFDASSDNPISNSAVAKAFGDVDAALDGIIAIQDSLAPTAFLPGEEG